MSKGLYFTIGLILGAAAGAGVAHFYYKDKYEKLQDEELQARRKEAAALRKEEEKSERDPDEKIDVKKLHEKPSIMEYAEKLSQEGYTNYSGNDTKEEKGERVEPDDEPYVIPPETYDEGERDGYERISMTYYADGVVADDADEELEDVERVLGDFADHFGDYEDDVVYVRNESTMVDYEICKDNRTYEEVSGKKPDRVRL